MASPVEMSEMYDTALLGILQHVGDVQSFLRVYFGFLFRKTDFYRLLAAPGAPNHPPPRMGFPPGAAEKMVLKTFRLFERVAEQDRDGRLKELQQREEEAREEASAVPPAEQELEIQAEPQEEEAAAQMQSSPSDAVAAAASVSDQAAGGSEPRSSSRPGRAAQRGGQASAAAAAGTKPVNQDQFQENPESYNGAVRENYTWSQDYTDVEIRVHVPKNIVKGRQVCVSMQSSSVCVSLTEGAAEVLMDGELSHKINKENSLWSLEPGRCVVLSLSKCGEVWWNAVLKGEKEIDVNQINRERTMATVDEEEHAVLDRLTFDYHQKLQGKPQSHEMKVHEMLKKGWDAEGSPFKGQQFDPSMFDIPPSAVQF